MDPVQLIASTYTVLTVLELTLINFDLFALLYSYTEHSKIMTLHSQTCPRNVYSKGPAHVNLQVCLTSFIPSFLNIQGQLADHYEYEVQGCC